MAFPTTSVLDDFNRANTGPPLSANWSTIGWAAAGMQVASNLARGATVSVACGEYWNPGTFGADLEVYVTLNAKATAGDYASFTMDIRIQSPGSGANIDSYELEIVMREGGANVNIARIWKGINGSYSQLGADIATTVNAGDSFGLEITGEDTTTIAYYRKPAAGAWGLVDSRDDSSSPITAAGNISLGTYESTSLGTLTLNDFGGGTVTSGDASPTATDSATETETTSLTAVSSGVDTGALAEAAATAVTSSGVDSATTAEAASLVADVPATDSGSLSEAAALTADGSGVDSGALSDAATLAAAVPAVDSATETETVSVTAVSTGTDSGTLSEASQVDATTPIAGTDAAVLSESAVLTVTVVTTDNLTFVESGAIGAAIIGSDSGAVSDAGSLDTGEAVYVVSTAVIVPLAGATAVITPLADSEAVNTPATTI